MSDPCFSPRGQIRHQLKTWPQFFHAVLSGYKRHEIRNNDRCFRVGDELELLEWDPDTETYTGSKALVAVTYVTDGGSWGIPTNLVVMSIQLQTWATPNEPAITDL